MGIQGVLKGNWAVGLLECYWNCESVIIKEECEKNGHQGG